MRDGQRPAEFATDRPDDEESDKIKDQADGTVPCDRQQRET
jgi:hypothetical protein